MKYFMLLLDAYCMLGVITVCKDEQRTVYEKWSVMFTVVKSAGNWSILSKALNVLFQQLSLSINFAYRHKLVHYFDLLN